MKLSERSEANLAGVHPALVTLWNETPLIPECSRAEVVQGLRTVEQQEKYVAAGSSDTMNSRHLTGHAFDFALYRDEDGDGDLDFIKKTHPYYKKQADAFAKKGKELGIPIFWGGNWAGLVDGMHIQLTWKDYPIGQKTKTVANSKTIAAATAGVVAAIAEAPITMFPEIVATVNSITDSIPWIGGPWMDWLPTVIAIAAFVAIINFRRQKIEQEGV